ncbi:Protein of unknown function (DUF1278) [Abeliophyllum distichum]|uniref:Prolamin-like domain-containing protein n=1 Tax=Abeliophyllum distichum TaxID=126358 RepID=A0ABD1SUE8_9LAMI
MANMRTMQAIALIFACISIVATPNFAQQLNVSDLSLTDSDLTHSLQCIRSVITIPRCFEELLVSIFSLKLELLGPECCEALLKVDANCWPEGIPVNPLFPLVIKGYCILTQI